MSTDEKAKTYTHTEKQAAIATAKAEVAAAEAALAAAKDKLAKAEDLGVGPMGRWFKDADRRMGLR